VKRPSVSVVVPFAGDRAAAQRAVRMLRALRTTPGDELILSDNSVTLAQLTPPPTLVHATGERSPSHARNAGAARATGEWILFLDADTQVPEDLLDRYFERDVGDRVGALAGEIRAAPAGSSFAARYAAQRNFLSASAHMAHPYRPRAAAANLMIRRAAFEQAGGFREGLRAAEDTDLCWRLQALGWSLELRERAHVAHQYRATVGELRAQWRSYAAGRAWLERQYPDFHPRTAASRAPDRALKALRRALRRTQTARREHVAAAGAPVPPAGAPSRLEATRFLAMDALLAVDELVGMRMDNRPPREEEPR
jgi:GT2 family glycosyltransferase